jgi:hypothetical protein
MESSRFRPPPRTIADLQSACGCHTARRREIPNFATAHTKRRIPYGEFSKRYTQRVCGDLPRRNLQLRIRADSALKPRSR